MLDNVMVFGMTGCIRLLHGVYTERIESVRNDNYRRLKLHFLNHDEKPQLT